MSVDPLVDSLNRLIFHLPHAVPQTSENGDSVVAPQNGLPSISKEYFPLKVSVAREGLSPGSLKSLKNELSKNHWRWGQSSASIDVSFSTKAAADAAVAYLLEKKFSVSFDYSKFVSHPGTLFVKNLARASVSQDKLHAFFNDASKYRSVCDVNIISSASSASSSSLASNSSDSEASAILKFDNYLDVDYITSNLPLAQNPFHSSLPLYVNRYVSKRERAMCPDSAPSSSSSVNSAPEDSILYDTLVIENLGDFFSNRAKIDELRPLVEKFALFGPIDSIYWPMSHGSEDSLSFRKVGFICFAHERNLNQDILRCLYYLRDLTFDEFDKFSEQDIYDIKEDINKPHKFPESSDTPRLKISIAQRKHNHHLYESAESLYAYNEPGSLKMKVCDPSASDIHDDTFLSKFMKASNYQETNVYVNNLPILFENNDDLWASFWDQFGVEGVKSAKIIKPQFYSKKSDESLGRIGFVFYEEFKMALRAIILTNNKVVSLGNGPGMAVQASFAIQKHNNSSGSGKSASSSLSSGSNYNYYNDGYGKRFSLPMNDPNFYMHEPRLPNHAASPGASPFVPPDYYYYPYYMPMQPPPEPIKKEEENGGHSPKQAPPQMNPNAAPYPNPMGYMYHPYYSMPQVPPQSMGMGNGPGPYFNNYSMRQPGKERKGERKKS
ncbi:hypothetical protein FT663_00114 [Candidozyma haemuli var. vulneris]|uniref:RRM domain-containing protein n=1 Tax=Candidozyma haemuli TaxID=45357 RepID=A0A2V1AM03_9ASCO|nr:hypothetical protein CXQ85_001094 [[Candida] haemuloni]KAF3994144.1 hypothetical protein FT662_00013 [[Candida] haemuloni var. vulneris]KAF3995692.1 hypothetical protein FT663_00114 [[Candida] haemuloni var. vulneris]PVH18805.1 hypothetical protein CXQ85_001094 [[Candida] haemuloni]